MKAADYIDTCQFGDVRAVMREMIADGVKVQTIVTSPPYWGLRSYLPADHPDKALEIGSEPTLRDFIVGMVEVFDLARELLADDGTAWVNMGDSYAASWGSQGRRYSGLGEGGVSARQIAASQRKATGTGTIRDEGIKPKDLMGQPWRLAFALQDAGWWLRQDIIWNKPNAMPESVTDRCTKAHEYLFLLSKSPAYYCDMDAISEAIAESSDARLAQNIEAQAGSNRVPGKTNGPMKAVSRKNSFARTTKNSAGEHGQKPQFREDREPVAYKGRRNKRSVWTVPTQSYSGAHFATFPTKLIEPCILAGAPVGGIVFDPFLGSGTTGQVAQALGRHFIGIDLNRANAPLQADRLKQPSFFLEVA